MATIHVDGKTYYVNGANNLLQACLSLGLDIPYFCWHPALGSVGACRQCAVKQFQNTEDSQGRLVMSCMTPALDGTIISINDSETKRFRKNVVELLMINHPHDCPVCEEGGNCHLQDMTVMVGHTFRRYRFNKRTHLNQNLGPFISHEMNRCITCYRCVRYYQDYADGNDLSVYGSHDNIYFGRIENGVLENEFSGNLVEICPTGVFTDKTHAKRYNRKWDMQFAPSICQQCSIGCNISPGERYGELRRIDNRYNGTVNHYFLCDRGRFGYGYVNLQDRPRQPMQYCNKKWITLTPERAIQEAINIISHANKVIGIGSPRASMESNFALRKLVGVENFSTGILCNELKILKTILKILYDSGVHIPSLSEIENYDAILVLGEDLTQCAPRIALALRQAVKGKLREMAADQKIPAWQMAAVFNLGQKNRYPLFLTNIDATRLDDIAAWSYHSTIEDQARLGFAIAHKIDVSAPSVDDLDRSLTKKINVIVQALQNAKKPLIISGTHSGSQAIVEAAANITIALKRKNKDVGITLLPASVNSIGLSMIGGHSLEYMLDQLINYVADVVIIMESDIYRYLPKNKVDLALQNTPNIIVLDHQNTLTTKKAGLILPSSSFAESSGTVVNHESRAQRFFQVYDPSYYNKKIKIRESWNWLYSLDKNTKKDQNQLIQLDNVIDDFIVEFPELKGIKYAAPDSNFRISGQKLARSPHRSSGRTAMLADISVHEPPQPQDKNTMFSFSMEGHNQAGLACSQIPFVWAPGWNSQQAWNKFQVEVGKNLINGDPGVRLIETSISKMRWFKDIPATFNYSQEYWHIAPYYHLFGSEEMTQRAPAIQHLITEGYVMMNPKDAAKIGVMKAGVIVEFNCQGEKLCLPVRFSENLKIGQVGLPLGFPSIPLFLINNKIKNLREAPL